MKNISLVALAVTLFGGSVFAQTTFTVRIENVSTAMTLITSTPDSQAVPMSPGVWAVHTGADALFSAGAADRGDGLEAIAEDGNPTTLAAALAGRQGVLSSNLFNTPVGASGPAPIGPGGAYEFTFNAPPGARLSFATMFIPSNDLFLAPEGDGIALFNPDGSSFSGEVTDQIMLWDAGTEENQEPGVGNNQAQRQPAANTGPADPNNLVRLVNDGFTYPAVSQVIRVTVNPVATVPFTVRIENVSTAMTLITSTPDSQAVPMSPGVWAVHTGADALFSPTSTLRFISLIFTVRIMRSLHYIL